MIARLETPMRKAVKGVADNKKAYQERDRREEQRNEIMEKG